MAHPADKELLDLLGGATRPTPDQFKKLITELDHHEILAKVFVLDGVPYIFEKSPMKYMVFKEQVAERFRVGSHDVCIVGSAKLGFSPSPYKYGTPFDKTSDVDVVIISEPLFNHASRELFAVLNQLPPNVYEIRPFVEGGGRDNATPPTVKLSDWKTIKEAIRNFVYQNFNPGLLPVDHALRRKIFENISSTAGLFLALEPRVFVSRIRGRIFRTWKAAENYYANSLREAKRSFLGASDIDEESEEGEEMRSRPNEIG
jgi:hypothetical protein